MLRQTSAVKAPYDMSHVVQILRTYRAALAGLAGIVLIALTTYFYPDNVSAYCLIHEAYVDDDFPVTWDIGPLDKVNMIIEDTIHYALDTEAGAQEWSALIPGGDGVVRLGPNNREFTISMIHQLKCLNLIRVGVVQRTLPLEGERSDVRHCMNYLRQMILCRSDLYLETVRDPYGPRAVPISSERTCRDWSQVYAEFKRKEFTNFDI